MNGFVSLPVEEWAKMEDKVFWLSCLERAGVDNWDGIDYAIDLYNLAEEE